MANCGLTVGGVLAIARILDKVDKILAGELIKFVLLRTKVKHEIRNNGNDLVHELFVFSMPLVQTRKALKSYVLGSVICVDKISIWKKKRKRFLNE